MPHRVASDHRSAHDEDNGRTTTTRRRPKAPQDEGPHDQPFHSRRHAGDALRRYDVCCRHVRTGSVVRRPMERDCRHQERSLRPSIPVRRNDQQRSGLLRGRRTGQPYGTRITVRQCHREGFQRPAIRRRLGPAFAQHRQRELARPRPQRELRRRVEREPGLSAHGGNLRSFPRQRESKLGPRNRSPRRKRCGVPLAGTSGSWCDDS